MGRRKQWEKINLKKTPSGLKNKEKPLRMKTHLNPPNTESFEISGSVNTG